MSLKNIQSAKDIQAAPKWKVLLTGDSGGGKTTALTTLPKPVLIIDTDNRATSLAGFDEVDIITIVEPNAKQPKAWQTLAKTCDEIWAAVNKDSFPYASVALDGLSSIGRYAMNACLLLTDGSGARMKTGPGGVPAQPHYMPQMTMVSNLIFGMLSLPLNVAFTAHIDLYEDQVLHTLAYYPKITGKHRTEISAWFNETYRCTRETEGGETNYVWLTDGTGRWDFLKSSANQLGKYWKSPVEIDFAAVPVGFEWLTQQIKNSLH